MIRKKEENREIVIDLTGPDGNAFVLLGYANRFGTQLGWSKERIAKVQEWMKSSDYENLVTVFDREFGSFVTLER
jgi:hypothetical protein